MSLLDAATPQPPSGRRPLRYQRVIDLVEELIRVQGLQPGSLLPTQKELAKLAGVSLITVRRALDELEREGRVAGHQGVGTFVARQRIVSEPARRGGLLATFADQVRAQSAIDRFTSNAYDLLIEGESYRSRLKPGRRPGGRA